MAETELATYQDAVELVLDYVGEGFAARDKRMARRAVHDSYHEIVSACSWSLYQTYGRVTTVADVSDGTIAYDHTGGASDRLVTLSDATWPEDVEYGTLKIGNYLYNVEAYIDSTNITLTRTTNPGADVAAGTSYTWFRDTYTLPIAFQRMRQMREMHRGYVPEPVQSDQWLAVMKNNFTPNIPTCYCILGEPENYNSMAIKFGPPPTAAYLFDYIFDRMARQLLTLKDGAGLTITTSGTTVTASSAVFKTKHVGCLMRTAETDADDEPAGLAGAEGKDPYHAQRVLVAVTDSTHATMDAGITGDLSAVKFTISDPLDIDTAIMLPALNAMCIARFLELTGSDAAGRARKRANDVLRQAMDNDARSLAPAQAGSDEMLKNPVSRDMPIEYDYDLI